MRNLLIALFVFAGFVSEAQYSYFLKIKRQNGFDTLCSKDASPDSLFWKSGNTYTYYAINKVTKYFSQGNIIGLTSALDAKADVSHTHIISNVTGLQAALDAKGTSNFDGVYSSLTGKPTLFDGTYSSLTGKPATFAPSSHTHVIADITNFGSYANASHTHVKADITDLGTIPTNNNQLTNGAGYLTGNQSITLSGDISGSGATAITTAIGASKVTNAMLAGSIAYSKLALTGAILNADLAGSIADAKILSAATWNAKQSAITTGTTAQYFRGDLSLATFPTTTAAFSNSTDKNFVTDAQATVIGNTSGTNTGDNAVNSLYSGLVSNATHTGDATGGTALTLATVNSNVGSFGSATQVAAFTVNGKGLVTAASNTSIAIAESQVTSLVSDLAAKAPLASPAFTGTPTGITASHVGLGNVTNESKATMFTSPTFTGNAVLGTPASGNFSTGTFTWPTFNQNTTGTAGGLSADIAESRVTNLVSDLAAKASLASPAFTGTATGIGIPVYARVTSSDATTTGQALTNINGLSVALTTSAVYEFEAVLGVTTSAVTTGTQYAVQYSVAGGAVEGGITGPLTSTAAKAERIAALNTATSAYLTTSAQTGQVIIKGIITTGANAGNLTIQHLKVTSGTSTIKINSFLKVTRIS
jgi:hypothetical protein